MSQTTYKDDAGNLVIPSIIDGRPIIISSSRNFPVECAAQQKIIHYGQTATLDLVKQAVDSAAKTFKKFKRTPVDERFHLLLKTADLLEKKVEEAAGRLVNETSAASQFSLFNAKQLPRIVREVAGSMKTILTGELTPTLTGSHQLVFKEAVGVVLEIMPWNGALALPCRGLSSALAAGCTVILKASELCPWTHYLLVETFLEAGFPPGSVNMVMSERSSAPDVTETIIAHPALAKIEFIGSAPVGKSIGGLAAKYLKPIVMELGDQSPLIVLDDADLEKAAKAAVAGNLACHGQLCFGTERVIVQSSIKDKFYSILKSAMAAAPPHGAAVTTAYAKKAKGLVDDALNRGAKILSGSSEYTGPASLSPSILVDMPTDAALSKAEGFCPTMFVTALDTDEDIIEEANSRDGGLSASIFTSNWERGLIMSRELDFGNVMVNLQTNHVDAAGPVTGWKQSGWGSGFGKHGIEEFLHLKAVAFGYTAGEKQLSVAQRRYETMN